MSVKKYIAEKCYVPDVRVINSVFKHLGFFQNTSRTCGLARTSEYFVLFHPFWGYFFHWIILLSWLFPVLHPVWKWFETIFPPKKNAYHQPLADTEPSSQGWAAQRWFVCLYGFFAQGMYIAQKSGRICHLCSIQYALFHFFQAYSTIAFPSASSGSSF